MGMNVVILGSPSGVGGEIANQLARLGHEAYAMPGAVALEILAGLRPQLILPVAPETGMTTDMVRRLAAETGAAVIVVAPPGDAWVAWAEHLKYPVVPPERAAVEIPARLHEFLAQVQAAEQTRYLQGVYGAQVVISSLPRVIGFGGPKGGTGKSTVAANAAALLAARGVPIHVIDAESDTRGNQADLFRLGEGTPIYSIIELAGASSPPPRTGGVFEPGAHVPAFWTSVPAPRGIRWNLRVTAGLLTLDPIMGERSFAVLARAADWLDFAIERATGEGFTVILDTGNNLMSPLSLRAINRSQILYIVLEPEDTGLIAGASWLAHVYRIAGPEAFSQKIRIVFNKVRGESGSELVGRLREHVEGILGHRLPRAMPVYILPYLELDIARAQTNLRHGAEYLAALQALAGGRYQEEARGFAEALQALLSELFPAIRAAAPTPPPRPRFRLPWGRE